VVIAGDSDCDDFDIMKGVLLKYTISTSVTYNKYLPTKAIQAHEDVHVADIKTAFDSRFAALKSAIESLTVPLKDYPTAEAARSTIIALPTTVAAYTVFLNGAADDIGASHKHVPLDKFLAAQNGELSPLISAINNKNCP
jgi:hypothetical protein